MRVDRRLLVGLFAMLMSTPALAWEFGTSDNGEVFWTMAEDTTAQTKVAFFCTTVAPGVILAEFKTNQPGPDKGKRVPVQLGFSVAGNTFGEIVAYAETIDGTLVVTASGDQRPLANAARAVYATSDTIVLNYYENAWSFPGAGHSDAFGAMLDACG